ncbi:WW domain-containing oxidoreductase [Lepeophtheirus salmonis]|uniref:WW domain-containing oxidoreductase n=1 Tax=Lepeophtheirus salmonis TaxID=72036 RepID=UPI001AE27D60|nr:WW domain-containing oxidoreductase-like [Lepeophtheirus salmonis]
MIYLPESDSEDELPPEWEERVTHEGKVYFANNKSQVTQWSHPRTGKRKEVSSHLPYGWEKKEFEGKTVYVDHRRGKTSFIDPRLAFASEVKDSNASFYENFRQRFDASTSAMQILHGADLSGMIFIVTGGNSGIGYETVKTFLHYGGTVILACRDIRRGEEAISKLKSTEGTADDSRIIALECDLSSLESTDAFVLKFKSLFDKLDVLVLNAGVFGLSYYLTVDGFEQTFQINFLSHLYLAYALRRSLIRASSPKIVIVSSESHRFASLASIRPSSWDAITFSSPFSKDHFSFDSYNNSKFLLVVLGLEMDRRWRSMGIRTLLVHPGNCISSSLSRHWFLYKLLFTFVRPFSKSLQQAAASTVFASVSNEMKGIGGIYINNCFPCPPHESAVSSDAGWAAWQIAFEMIESRIGEKKLSNL